MTTIMITIMTTIMTTIMITVTLNTITVDGCQVRSVYHACMNEPLIEEIGLQPLKDKLRSMGGWPVLEVSLPIQRILLLYLPICHDHFLNC